MEEYIDTNGTSKEEADPSTSQIEVENVKLMRLAAKDPLFLADLEETMHDFRYADAGWWERPDSSS